MRAICPTANRLVRIAALRPCSRALQSIRSIRPNLALPCQRSDARLTQSRAWRGPNSPVRRFQSSTSSAVSPHEVVRRGLQRHTIRLPASATSLKWLDFSDGSDVHAVYRDAETRLYSQQQLEATTAEYYTLSAERAAELAAAAEELHGMFVAAADKVLHDDSLFTTFRIPLSLHARIRSSFASHRAGLGDHPICGRLDLAVHEAEAKVNAAPASAPTVLPQIGLPYPQSGDCRL